MPHFSDPTWTQGIVTPMVVNVNDTTTMICGGENQGQVATNRCWFYNWDSSSMIDIEPMNGILPVQSGLSRRCLINS